MKNSDQDSEIDVAILKTLQEAIQLKFEGPSVGKEYIALLPEGKIRRIGVIGYMENPLLGTLLCCMVESRKTVGLLYYCPVAPGAVMTAYDPDLLTSMRERFREVQANILPLVEEEINLPLDLTEGSYMLPVAQC